METWIWILLAVAIVVLFVVGAATLRAIRPKAPEEVAERRTPRPAPSEMSGSAHKGEAAAALSPAVIAQIDALVVAEQKIRAIKVLREATGSTLQEAKTRIDTWIPAASGDQMSSTPPLSAPSSADAAARLDATVRAEVGALVAAGQKISAIKLFRDATGLGLKESKDAIDSWR